MTIEIRHAEPDDYAAVQTIHAQPKAVWGTLQVPFPSAQKWKQRLADSPKSLVPLVACIDDEPVGLIVLGQETRSPRRRHVAWLGMAVHDAHAGKGIGTALTDAAVDLADNWLNILRIELTVYTDNAPAIALYKKFGFKTEGTFERYAFRDGRYVDAYAMARLRATR